MPHQVSHVFKVFCSCFLCLQDFTPDRGDVLGPYLRRHLQEASVMSESLISLSVHQEPGRLFYSHIPRGLDVRINEMLQPIFSVSRIQCCESLQCGCRLPAHQQGGPR